MELVQTDTQRAYDLLQEKIVTRELVPGAPINEQVLAEEFGLSQDVVYEALKLLGHDKLVVATPRHGFYVADVNIPDLKELSEMRLALETLCARLAAQRITPADLELLAEVRREQKETAAGDIKRLFDVDHKFHQVVARAARNEYLAETLERFYGLSLRLWYLALPHLDFLSSAVDEHQELLEAFQAGDADRAAQLMYNHVDGFYNRVQEILKSNE